MAKKYLALDKKTNDLIKIPGEGVCRVTSGRFIVQLVQNKLKTLLGEWVLDDQIGYLSLEDDYIKNFDVFKLEARLIEIVINTKNVKSLDSINIIYNKRQLDIQFTATTTFGKIDLSKPWGEEAEYQVISPGVATPVTYNGVPVTFGGQVVYNTN